MDKNDTQNRAAPTPPHATHRFDAGRNSGLVSGGLWGFVFGGLVPHIWEKYPLLLAQSPMVLYGLIAFLVLSSLMILGTVVQRVFKDGRRRKGAGMVIGFAVGFIIASVSYSHIADAMGL